MTRQSIRVLTCIESNTVTGPSRILIDFASEAAIAEPGLPSVEVTLLTFHRGQGESALATAARSVGVPVMVIPERKRWDVGVLPKLRSAVAELKPDILETRNVKSHFLVRASGLQRRYPWVAWNHGYTSINRMDRAYNQLDRWSLRGAFRVMTVCGPFASALESRGIPRTNISILHNFVKRYLPPSAEELQRIKRELGLHGELVILVVGRLSSEKGHADLLHAMAVLNRDESLPKFRVVLVGDGPELDNLSQLSRRLGVNPKLIMAGFQRDVGPYYGVANIFALPSHSEGSPNVVLEAMAAGLPIAATSVGGVPEIVVDGENALLVPAREPEAMANALRRLLTSEELRKQLGLAASARAESVHTFDAYKRSLTEFYVETLLTSGSRKGVAGVRESSPQA